MIRRRLPGTIHTRRIRVAEYRRPWSLKTITKASAYMLGNVI